jgi:nucleotide-binding universal stress UspA family protein
MNARKRLLFGYDGSSYADAALEDLQRAGLPDEVEALVATVVEGVLPPEVESEFTGGLVTSRSLATGRLIQEQAQANAEEAGANLARATGRLRVSFPRWQVQGEALRGAPAEAIIRRADECGADLIVVGSQGRPALGRLILGSVSKKVVTESRCSVRVARRDFEKDDGAPPRIIVGVDGSPGAERAVRAVGERIWPDGTEVRLVIADDRVSPARFAHVLPTAAAQITERDEQELARARTILEWADQELRVTKVNVSSEIKKSDPLSALIEEVQQWGADSIFVGSVGLNHLDERAGLGGVSAGLVTNASCSVEVVR